MNPSPTSSSRPDHPLNPSPGSRRPFTPPPFLVDTRLPRPGHVPVTLTRGYPATQPYLDMIERVWAPERAQLVTELAAQGETLESAHWQWTNKVARVPNWHCLVIVECEGQVQGIMAVENLLRPSRLSPGAWVLYVDFIESAPWNYRVPQDRTRPAVREGRFRRVGTLLIAEAIRMSLGTTAGVRVGLHGLGQAEEFYVQQCGMASLGPDPNYYDLVYFEYPDGVAQQHLTELEVSA